MSDEAFPFLHSRCLCVAGVPTRAIRTSGTGELGWELYARQDGIRGIYDAIMASGLVGDFGTFALNSLRIEKGLTYATVFCKSSLVTRMLTLML